MYKDKQNNSESSTKKTNEEKMKMWTDNGQQTTDAKWWQKLTLTIIRMFVGEIAISTPNYKSVSSPKLTGHW
jgi:hypothetical protein